MNSSVTTRATDRGAVTDDCVDTRPVSLVEKAALILFFALLQSAMNSWQRARLIWSPRHILGDAYIRGGGMETQTRSCYVGIEQDDVTTENAPRKR